MKGTRIFRTLTLAAGLGLLASAAWGWQRDRALGDGGELYTVRAGLYGTLFPQGGEAAAEHAVLALEVARPGEPAVRYLVPGTGDADVERTPTVVFEDSSSSVFLVWETTFNYHPLLRLASFDGRGWSEVLQVPGSVFGYKSSPQISVTRDSYRDTGADGKVITVSRTVLHLIWEEEDGDGRRTLYQPIILENGHFTGFVSAIELNRLDSNSPAELAYELGDELVRSPSVQPGRDSRTVVVAFADPASKRLATVEISVLPRELSRLADKARVVLIDMGARSGYPKNLGALADRVRQTILDAGGAFQPEVIQAIAQRVADEIRNAGSRTLETLAGDARVVLIDMGARLTGPGLRNATGNSSTPHIMEVAGEQRAPSDPMSAAHLLQFRLASSRPAPRVPAGDVTLFSSRSGGDALIAVAQDGRVVYRDTKDDSWNDSRELALSENLDLGRAFDILVDRIRDR